MSDDKIVIKVDASGIDKRLDVFLTETHPELTSRSHIKKLIDGGHILVNDLPAKPNHKLRASDVIIADLSEERQDALIIPENIPLVIVYEDEHILVVNKPAGMASHPAVGANFGTLVNALLYHCKALSGAGTGQRPGIVHRLDKDTSGLMVVAKDNDSHSILAKQFKDRTITKKYVAFATGIVKLDEGSIEFPIGRHPSQRQKLTVRFSESRDAVTLYKVLGRFPGFKNGKKIVSACTMLELTPKTGRMHQLRVHLYSIGHPILGDATYGKKSDLIPRQALHATRLGFIHPASKKYVEFSAGMPADMKKVLDFLNLSPHQP